MSLREFELDDLNINPFSVTWSPESNTARQDVQKQEAISSSDVREFLVYLQCMQWKPPEPVWLIVDDCIPCLHPVEQFSRWSSIKCIEHVEEARGGTLPAFAWENQSFGFRETALKCNIFKDLHEKFLSVSFLTVCSSYSQHVVFLLRFSKAVVVKVTIDDIDVCDLNVHHLRDQIGVVSQVRRFITTSSGIFSSIPLASTEAFDFEWGLEQRLGFLTKISTRTL